MGKTLYDMISKRIEELEDTGEKWSSSLDELIKKWEKSPDYNEDPPSLYSEIQKLKAGQEQLTAYATKIADAVNEINLRLEKLEKLEEGEITL